jgi:diguanylate cyclase (GGDEF)-like protein
LTRRLQQLVAVPSAHRRGHLALTFIDLDRFKVVNDSLGHEAGDKLLRLFGLRLREALSETDLAARLGGDEFAVISECLEDGSDGRETGDRLLAMLQEPFALDDHTVVVDASIGVAVARDDDDVATLLRKADIAMYQAKRAGGSRCFVFSGDLDKQARERLDLEVELRSALAAGQICAYYQPMVDTNTQEVVALEALARWKHPERGLIPPDEFLPVAAETGLIVEIDQLIMRESCRELAELRREMPQSKAPFASINVSPATLEREHFAAETRAILEETGLEPQGLQIEITESSMITSSPWVSITSSRSSS